MITKEFEVERRALRSLKREEIPDSGSRNQNLHILHSDQRLDDYFRIQEANDINSSAFVQALPDIKSEKYHSNTIVEKERQLPRSLSPIDHNISPRKEDEYKIVEGGLAECPNCSRTFFPNRLTIHLKSCKPGKPLIPKKNKRSNIKWKNPKKKEVKKSKFRMPLLGKDMMITGKIIEKAEEEEEDSDNLRSQISERDYDEEMDFDQYKEFNEDYLEARKQIYKPHLITSLKDKVINKRERCEF